MPIPAHTLLASQTVYTPHTLFAPQTVYGQRRLLGSQTMLSPRTYAASASYFPQRRTVPPSPTITADDASPIETPFRLRTAVVGCLCQMTPPSNDASTAPAAPTSTPNSDSSRSTPMNGSVRCWR